MTIKKWIFSNTESLKGKTVAVTGSTGGLGNCLCVYLAQLGASLILIDRNRSKSLAHKEKLLAQFPDTSIECISLNLEDIDEVYKVTEHLKDKNIDIFIHNAGAYAIERRTCKTGYNNIYQINFASPYYMIKTLLPNMNDISCKVIVVGSIAHNYSETDPCDIDFSSRKACSKVYGNAKRHLMFSLYNLFDGKKAKLSVTHPGITFTNITAHYPKLIFAIIKHPMKVIFMRPRKAALSVIKGIFDETGNCEWIGPSVFNVWGYPKKKKIKTAKESEIKLITEIADSVFETCRNSACKY